VMRLLATVLSWQGLLVSARPQSAKIIFSTDELHPLGHGTCDHEKGLLYWLEDGQCYDVGERGPCNFGEVLWFVKKPTCIPENEVPNTKTTTQLCNEEGLIYWPDTGLCYSLLTQGPCPEGHWLQLANKAPATATCVPRPCEDVELEVFWPEICRCIPANRTDAAGYGPEDVCGPGSELAWSPFGEGVCICSDHFYADQQGNCFEIGSVGPCEDGYIWGVVDGTTSCMENSNEIRVFDLIPANSPNGLPKSRTTQTQTCHVDEKGKCRKTLNLRNRFGDADSFTSWIASFDRRSSEKCQVTSCEGDRIPWLDGKCYQLASTGPCAEGSWLILDSIIDGNSIIKCKSKRCNEGIWWPKTCSCINNSVLPKSQSLDFSNIPDFVSPCDTNEQILLNPYGDGICGCKTNHIRDTKGKCYEIGAQGACEQGKVVSSENGETVCVNPANVTNRIFDLIPANENPASRSGLSVSRATRKNCHVDEQGNCRKTLNIRGRIDVENKEPNQQIQDLIGWFGTFEKQPDTCEVTSVCEGDMILWEDGNCYHLATSGPCENGKWLVLDSITDGVASIKCKEPKCSEGIWFSEFCSCFTGDAIDEQRGPCGQNEDILINPYGEGVCSCKDRFIRHVDGLCYEIGSDGPCAENETFTWSGSQGVCESSDLKKRLFDLIPANSPSERSGAGIGRTTRQNCHIDELGKCRKTLNLRNRIDSHKTEMVDWLVQFVNNEGKCNDLETPEERKEDKCHREGKVLFEDGECYNLLERGPCFEDAKWLVMSLENGSLVPRCKHRKCLTATGAYLTSDCQCYHRKAADVCGVNEQLYDDIFGQGICGCSPGHAIWEGDDACHPVHQQGPCEDGKLFELDSDGRTQCIKNNCSQGLLEVETESDRKCFVIGDSEPCQAGFEVGINYQTLKVECKKSEERIQRVFDLIPANQNQVGNNVNNTNRITKETCVLDKRGRCRRKLVLRRGANENEALDFTNWLQSFKVKYDTKCNR